MSKTAKKPPKIRLAVGLARAVMVGAYIALVVLVVTSYDADGFEVATIILAIAVGMTIVARQPGVKQLRKLIDKLLGR